MNIQDLKKIWNNKSQIVEGFKNSIIKDEFVENVSELRMEICNTCPDKDIEGKECVMPGTQPCCSLCGCSLSFKTRALSTACPAKKWASIISEKKEDQLDNL